MLCPDVTLFVRRWRLGQPTVVFIGRRSSSSYLPGLFLDAACSKPFSGGGEKLVMWCVCVCVWAWTGLPSHESFCFCSLPLSISLCICPPFCLSLCHPLPLSASVVGARWTHSTCIVKPARQPRSDVTEVIVYSERTWNWSVGIGTLRLATSSLIFHHALIWLCFLGIVVQSPTQADLMGSVMHCISLKKKDIVFSLLPIKNWFSFPDKKKKVFGCFWYGIVFLRRGD